MDDDKLFIITNTTLISHIEVASAFVRPMDTTNHLKNPSWYPFKTVQSIAYLGIHLKKLIIKAVSRRLVPNSISCYLYLDLDLIPY